MDESPQKEKLIPTGLVPTVPDLLFMINHYSGTGKGEDPAL